MMFEFLMAPVPEDAAVIGALIDRDADGEKPLVDSRVPFKLSFLRKKEIPGIIWQEGYFSVKQISRLLYGYFRHRLKLSFSLHHL